LTRQVAGLKWAEDESRFVERDRTGIRAFLTYSNRKAIGSNLKRLYPVDETREFDKLLNAIAAAEQKRRAR
jgi:hypothetical protein